MSTAVSDSKVGPAMRSASLPANLLLMGEYAVTQDGGLGVAMAIAPRAHGSWQPGGSLRVEGYTRSGRNPAFSWPGDDGLLGASVRRLLDGVGDPGGRFRLDTSAFFSPDGSKRGYGSSAVTVALLTALWKRAIRGSGSGTESTPALVDESIQLHRAVQGGRGSGYDVAASLTGGVIRFTGGDCPRAEPVEIGWLPPMVLFTGAAPVATTGAVARFSSWQQENDRDAASFLRRSNDLIRTFLRCRGWPEGRAVLDEYKKLARDLGDTIGVPAVVTPPEALLRSLEWWKAVGAGNELGVGVLTPEERDDETLVGARIASISKEGLLWQ